MRRAATEDARSVGDVFDAAVRHGWTFLGAPAQRPLFLPAHWEQLVADHAPPRALLVAVHERRGVVGFTAVHPENGELYLLFVHPDFAGRGVGRVLLAAAHGELRSAGHVTAFLFTEERNVRARAVYAAAGYRPDGVVRESDFDGEALRELRLVIDLRDPVPDRGPAACR